jgi:hypothetical protein
MLIDQVLPEFDATRTEHVLVNAPPERVWRAVQEADFMRAYEGSPGMRALFAARGAASAVVRALTGRPSPPEPEALRPSELTDHGEWVKLGERPGEELVFGAVGRFWGRDVNWREIDASGFGPFDEPGYGKVAANLSIRPYGHGRSLLSYEARTQGTDAAARSGFLRYWRIVGPGVGVVLRGTLRYIKGIAENA